jgi:hypothetical protein
VVYVQRSSGETDRENTAIFFNLLHLVRHAVGGYIKESVFIQGVYTPNDRTRQSVGTRFQGNCREGEDIVFPVSELFFKQYADLLSKDFRRTIILEFYRYVGKERLFELYYADQDTQKEHTDRQFTVYPPVCRGCARGNMGYGYYRRGQPAKRHGFPDGRRAVAHE